MSGSDTEQKHWYLVHCKPRQEGVAKSNLGRQGYETYLPLAEQRKTRRGRRATVVEPLFPRYLFIHLDQNTDNWGPIRSTIGVSTLVRFGQQPARVPDELVLTLKGEENARGVHDLPDIRLRAGDAVRIVDGSLMGYEGIFLAQSSRDRVVVLLDILQKQSRVTVPVEGIEPASQ